MNYLRIISLTVLATTSLGLFYYIHSKYFVTTSHQEIILTEEKEEYKRRPIDPGGIIMPNASSLIYDKLNFGKIHENKVNLLPEPEEPLALGFRANIDNVDFYDSIDDILTKLDLQDDAPNLAQEQPGQEVTDSNNHISEPLAPTTLNITRLPDATNKLRDLDTDSRDSSYKIQLSSAWSYQEAVNEWQRIQMRHIKYLKNAERIIKKVKVNNDRIIYLVMAGNYTSLNQAKLICAKLTPRKQNCIVIR